MPVDSSLLHNTNTALYTDKTGCSKDLGMKKVFKGGGYGVTMQSLENDANTGHGYLTPNRVSYSNCDKNLQKGGNRLGLGHPSLATTRFNHESAASYVFNASNADDTKHFAGGYAPFSKNPAGQQCGGKRRRKSRRKPRRKSRSKSRRRKPRRKSRRKSRSKSRRRKPRRKSRSKSRRRKYLKCKKCKNSKKKKCNCKYVRRRKTQRGGSSIFYSGIKDTLDNNSARLLRGDYTGNTENWG